MLKEGKPYEERDDDLIYRKLRIMSLTLMPTPPLILFRTE
jgi:hypothetical protein